MPDKVSRDSLGRGLGSIFMIDNPQALDEIGELSATINGNLSRQQGLEKEITESRWTHNPTEKTHKNLRYPYCG